MRKILIALLVFLLAATAIAYVGCAPGGEQPSATPAAVESFSLHVDEEGSYQSAEDVSAYIRAYGKLPPNFITKAEAKELGWDGGGLDGYADGKSIGGDAFGNREGKLPDGNYHECDIETTHAKSRGAKRLLYSGDGAIYYTEDHYETFTQLYGED